MPRITRRGKPVFAKAILAHVPYLLKCDLSKTAYRVLQALMYFADFKGRVFAKQKAIAEFIERPQSEVSRALKELERSAIIDRIKTYWQLNPDFVSYQ